VVIVKQISRTRQNEKKCHFPLFYFFRIKRKRVFLLRGHLGPEAALGTTNNLGCPKETLAKAFYLLEFLYFE
jgi:hypothetical protein